MIGQLQRCYIHGCLASVAEMLTGWANVADGLCNACRYVTLWNFTTMTYEGFYHGPLMQRCMNSLMPDKVALPFHPIGNLPHMILAYVDDKNTNQPSHDPKKRKKNAIMKAIESLKQDMNNSLKELDEKYNKKIEEMSKEMDAKYNKKFEEMSKSMNDTLGNQEKTIKQVMETVQELKTEMESMKKTQNKGRLDMESLGKRTETTESSITNRIQEMEERISESEDTIEKINALIKENSKSNKFSSQNIQEIWDTIKKPNLRIIGIEEGEELQIKGPENIFNKIIEENFPNIKNDISMKNPHLAMEGDGGGDPCRNTGPSSLGPNERQKEGEREQRGQEQRKPSSDVGWRYRRRLILEHRTEPFTVQMRSRRMKKMKKEIRTAMGVITH
ncbi:hypothetical protein U0070_018545 [Myodes glareolus]|uniref:Uncharacterized protein n=1 Tax=Myodes glareolus TaxID=447135 RepID=A0AAW0H9V9_MYOGA